VLLGHRWHREVSLNLKPTRKISFARFSSRFSRSKSFTRSRSEVLSPARLPESRSEPCTNDAATPLCTRSCRQSRRSPPTVMNTHAGAPPPSAPHAPELPLNTALMFPLPHPLKLWGLRESRGGSVGRNG
jgi:hypothetical protein